MNEQQKTQYDAAAERMGEYLSAARTSMDIATGKIPPRKRGDRSIAFDMAPLFYQAASAEMQYMQMIKETPR